MIAKLTLLLLSLCFVLPSNAKSVRNTITQDEHCLAITVWKEARGTSLAAQKAVLEVVQNRMLQKAATCLKVVREPSQFPWARRVKSWKATEAQLDRLDVLMHFVPQQLPSSYLYFNSVAHGFGQNTKKIGALYFSH